MPGTFQFLDMQRKQREEEVQKAASRLESFSAEVSIYSINDQHSLLLKRADELAEALINAGLHRGATRSEASICDDAL